MAEENSLPLDANPLPSESNPAINRPEEENETVKYIGPRNAILFSAGSGEPLPPLELPDDFFNLNQDEVKAMMRELKQNREDYENQPLRTKAVRELEESTTVLNRLKQYTQTVVRVQFPDRLVIQAVFNHSDTVQTVMDFLRDFLEPSEVHFYLYTAPPKALLRPEVTLIESKLTPRALVYFGKDSSPSEPTCCLKRSLLTSLTSIRLASEAALRYRREDIQESKAPKVDNEVPSTSRRKASSSTSSKSSSGSTSTKVPKWFKK